MTPRPHSILVGVHRECWCDIHPERLRGLEVDLPVSQGQNIADAISQTGVSDVPLVGWGKSTAD